MASLKLAGYRPRNDVHHNAHDIFSSNRNLGDLVPHPSEIQVGGIAHMGGKRYLVVEAEKNANCEGCSLILGGICQKMTRHPCSAYSRTDQTWVIFKEIVKNGSSK